MRLLFIITLILLTQGLLGQSKSDSLNLDSLLLSEYRLRNEKYKIAHIDYYVPIIGQDNPELLFLAHLDYFDQNFIQLNLLNKTDSSIWVTLEDSILPIKLEILKQNKWYPTKENKKSSCGNSYSKRDIGPKRMLISYSQLKKGNTKIKIRYSIQIIGGKILYSNVLTINVDRKALI